MLKDYKTRVKVKFTLEHTTKAQMRNRVIAVLFFNLGHRWGGWFTPRLGESTPGNDLVLVV